MANPPLLLLRLEGPLQSWGLRARWDVRDSGNEPSKSGIIGLLGCALGYGLHDPRLETELDAQLILGVRVEHPGQPLVDFHTVRGLLPTADGRVKTADGTLTHVPDNERIDPATIVSHRTYLQDAAFLAVLGGPQELLMRCHQALLNPRWPIYLGRKSCPPTRPVVEALTDRYPSLEAALLHYPWSCQSLQQRGLRPPDRLRYSLEAPDGPARRPDAVRHNPARLYGDRHLKVDWTAAPEAEGADACT